MIKPFKIFLFGLSVFVICFILSLSISDGVLSLGPISIRIPGNTFQNDLKQQELKDISNIIAISTLIDKEKDTVAIQDTLKKTGDSVKISYKPVLKISADSIKKLFRPLEYSQGNDSSLFPFFKGLESCKNKLIRILHYGDSQIEGDRITSYLRNQLQLNFGGEGIGLIPVVAVNPAAISFAYDISSNWEKFSPLQNSSSNKRYGVLLNYACIKTGKKLFAKNKESEAWIFLKHANTGYPLAQHFKQCQLFYGFNNSPMIVELKQNNTTVDADIVPVASGLSRLNWIIDTVPKGITISIKTTQSPEVYALSLDGLSGIAVDNIPLRGSSGLEFTKSDATFLRNFYNLLDVRLLIMQFGVNVVPNVRSDYEYYKNSFYEQLKLLKGLRRNLPIIVLGVSDVSRNGQNGFESYPNIELIRDAQKQAAFSAGCAFWDVYEAMGGKNSMPSWVSANPPLAQKDFIHFNPVGAKIIAEMFYRALIMEYERYLNLQNTSLSFVIDDTNE